MANEDLIKKPSITKLLKAKNNISSIDNDSRFKNLPSGYWVYDELLRNLKSKGWVRFAPGFKAGLYGHPQQQWCKNPCWKNLWHSNQYQFQLICH